jgi:UDP-4-amino-4,6-dideoxy-N-acetyl-beta-L-altrosamine transaminase
VSERLAIDGGRPVRATLLPYARQLVQDDDIAAVTAALRAPYLTTGPRVAELEAAFAARVGARHAVAVSSGTAALHAAMFAAGIGRDDEIVTTPLTFVATANAALYLGARPVFADVRADTLNLDPDRVAAALTPRTRALAPVDFAGRPCDLSALGALARARGLVLVEDACHALGAELDGRPVGSLSDLTVFSLHAVKHVTTGEGGVVTTDDDELARRLRRFRNHGLATESADRQASGALWSEMVDLGFNYRLTDVQCALGLSQLPKLGPFLAAREAIAERYVVAFKDLPGLTLLPPAAGARHAWHIFPVLVEPARLRVGRDAVFAALRAEGIGVTMHYVPAYWHPYYARLGYARGLCPVAEDAASRIFSLPIFPGMTGPDVEDVVTAVWKVLGHYRR